MRKCAWCGGEFQPASDTNGCCQTCRYLAALPETRYPPGHPGAPAAPAAKAPEFPLRPC